MSEVTLKSLIDRIMTLEKEKASLEVSMATLERLGSDVIKEYIIEFGEPPWDEKHGLDGLEIALLDLRTFLERK